MFRSPRETWKMSRLRKWLSRSDSSRPRSLPWLARSFSWRSACSTSPASTARREFQELALRRQAEHREHVRLLDLVAAEADELVEGGFGVAHAALGAAGDGVEGGRRRS